jgi:anaerobic magnesium-protoporphyrin IX monomethyl ester cyclase
MSGRKRIVFHSFRRTGYPNLGLAYISATLKQRNLVSDIAFVDETVDVNDSARRICALKPDIVGLSAASTDFSKVVELSRLLKQAANPMIWLGGAHITSVPETLPDGVDLATIGEGEQTASEAIALLSSGTPDQASLSRVRGLAFRAADGRLVKTPPRPFADDLDAIPMPDRDLFPGDYWQRGVTSLITSRGCPYRCAFCQVTAQRKECRYHSAERVVDEIQQVVDRYGVRVFDIVDDLFIANKRRIPAIVDGLRRRGLLGQIKFALNGRANLITDEVVALCKELGAFVVTLGLESMSQPVLSFLKDRSTVEHNARAVETIARGGLKVGGLFMIGTPGESLADILTTVEYVVENRDRFGGSGGMILCVTSPLPTTKLWDRCVELRRVDPDFSRFDWTRLRLAVAPCDLDQNIYVGDLPRDLFRQVFQLVHRIFYDQACIDSAAERHRVLDQLKALVTHLPATNAA